MLVKIKIKTPPGHARKFSDSMKTKIIIKMVCKGKIQKEWVDEKENCIYVLTDVTGRQYPSLVRNVGRYKNLMRSLANNKMASKALKKMADTPDVYKKTMELLNDSTEIEIVKGDTDDI